MTRRAPVVTFVSPPFTSHSYADSKMDTILYILLGVYFLDILLLFAFGLHAFLMIALSRRRREHCMAGETDPAATARELPVVTVQLPIYNEYYVIDRLIEGAVALDWPRKKLEIQVLDDSTDATREKTAELVEQYRRQGFNIQHLHRTDRTGHKAGALKAGLARARGRFVAVFDADFVPSPEFLRKTVPYFDDPEIGMVQTRWGHINEDYSLLTKAQSIGIDGHFMIEQTARNASELWMNFNGTGGIWRKQCILEAGNWQADTLTEDFDLSYRALLAGWKFRYFKDLTNPGEIPPTVQAFKSQQFRWCKGSIQTAVKLLPRILTADVNWKIKAEAVVHLLSYTMHPLMILNILFALPLLLMGEWTNHQLSDVSMVAILGVVAFMSVGTFGPIVFYIVSQRDLHPDRWVRRMIWLPFLMMIGIGVAVSNTRAWLEGITGRRSAFIRTPKLRIESKKDRVGDRKMYTIPLDPLVAVEFLMGVYCVVCGYFAFLTRPMLVPFMVIYAAGFFYVSILSIREALASREIVRPKQRPSSTSAPSAESFASRNAA